MTIDPIRPEEGRIPAPRLISVQDEAQVVAEKIKQVQIEIFRLDVLRNMNYHAYTDLVPGSNQSYADQKAAYEAAINRIQDCYPELVKLIRGATTGA